MTLVGLAVLLGVVASSVASLNTLKVKGMGWLLWALPVGVAFVGYIDAAAYGVSGSSEWIIFSPLPAVNAAVYYAMGFALCFTRYLKIGVDELQFVGYLALSFTLLLSQVGFSAVALGGLGLGVALLVPLLYMQQLDKTERFVYYLAYSAMSTYIFIRIAGFGVLETELLALQGSILGLFVAVAIGWALFHTALHIGFLLYVIPGRSWDTRLKHLYETLNKKFKANQYHAIILSQVFAAVAVGFGVLTLLGVSPALAVPVVLSLVTLATSFNQRQAFRAVQHKKPLPAPPPFRKAGLPTRVIAPGE